MSENQKLATLDLIAKIAQDQGIKPSLACAIAGVESGYDHYALRFEKQWNRFVAPDRFAVSNLITLETERVSQMCSWSCFQVMGAVARELGYSGPLSQLSDPVIGITLGCKKLKQLSKRYSSEMDVIAAYNAGSAIRNKAGEYVNQPYVNKVLIQLKIFRGN